MANLDRIYAFHVASSEYFEIVGNECSLRLKILTRLEPSQVFIRTEPDNEEQLIPMERYSNNDDWSFWQAKIAILPKQTNLYAFKFIVDGFQYWLDATGEVKNYPPERDIHFRFYPAYQPASWVFSQVFYQIFPDRFYDGEPSNNVKTNEYLYEGKPVVAKKWAELPDKNQGFREFYGGDLAGIRQKLDYLQELGVNSLYLNPIFVSASSHKYDTIDYFNIDPHFGTNEDFAALCKDLHAADMHIILDAVVNHTSERHYWFDRYGEYSEAGAYQTKDSKYREFYNFETDDPESYLGWAGVKTLPVLDYSSSKLQDMVYKEPDSILRQWLKPPYKIDGWRFDVIHMLGEGRGAKNNARYVREFRKAVREENPEAFILGEHFFEASKWLQGDQEDGAMNYFGFSFPVWAFFAATDHRNQAIKIDASDFSFLLARARARIPFINQLAQINLLGSHDTARFLTLLKKDIDLMKAAVTMLFTYIGVPSIYYGDEVGLEGEADPDCRRTFPWDRDNWNMDLFSHYQKLISLRKNSKALQKGGFIELYADGDIFGYARAYANETIITIVNRGKPQEINLPVWQLGLSQTSAKSFFSQREFAIKSEFISLKLNQGSELLIF